MDIITCYDERRSNRSLTLNSRQYMNFNFVKLTRKGISILRCKEIEIWSYLSFFFFFLLSFFLFSFPTGSVHAFFARVLFIKIHQDPLIFISSRTRNTTSYLVNLHYRTCAVIHIQRSREQNILQQL